MSLAKKSQDWPRIIYILHLLQRDSQNAGSPKFLRMVHFSSLIVYNVRFYKSNSDMYSRIFFERPSGKKKWSHNKIVNYDAKLFDRGRGWPSKGVTTRGGSTVHVPLNKSRFVSKPFQTKESQYWHQYVKITEWFKSCHSVTVTCRSSVSLWHFPLIPCNCHIFSLFKLETVNLQ